MLTKFLPLPDNNGGLQRSLAIARRLAQLGELVLFGYDDGNADHQGLRDLGIDVRSVPWHVTPGSVLRGVIRTQSFSAARFWSAAAAETVRRAAAEKSLDLLQVEYQQMVPLAAGIPAKMSVLDLHNVESALVDSYAHAQRGVAAAGLRAEAAALRRMERRTITRFDHVAIVSEQERTRLPDGARSVLVCPNGRDPSAVLPPAPDPTVAFVATMGWRPNIDAALWLGRDIWPLVVAQVPQARLLLVGRDPAPTVSALAGVNIEVTGTVPDVTPYLAESASWWRPCGRVEGPDSKSWRHWTSVGPWSRPPSDVRGPRTSSDGAWWWRTRRLASPMPSPASFSIRRGRRHWAAPDTTRCRRSTRGTAPWRPCSRRFTHAEAPRSADPAVSCGVRHRSVRPLGAGGQGPPGAARAPRPAGGRGHDLCRPEHAATEPLPPRIGLGAVAAPRDLHHARPDRPADRGGKPSRIGLAAGLWLAFAAWMVVGAVEGHLYHNRLTQDLYEAKDILYIVGAYVLAAGVPVRRYIDGGALLRLGNLTVACITIVDLMTMAHISFNTHLPGLPLQDFGAVGSETAAIALAIGTICFLVRLASGPVRTWHVLALVPIIGGVVLANQRAVLVNLGVVAGVLLVLLVAGSWHGAVRRFTVRAGQIVLISLAVVGVALAVLFVPAAIDQQPVHIPLSKQFDELFYSQGKVESAQDRLNLATEAEADPPASLHRMGSRGRVQLLRGGPTQGRAHRLCAQHRARSLAPDRPYRPHHVRHRHGDLARGRRQGMAATSGSHRGRLGSGHPRGAVRTSATAFLEPFLDEYRLATLFGVTLGMLRSSVTSMPHISLYPAGQPALGRAE